MVLTGLLTNKQIPTFFFFSWNIYWSFITIGYFSGDVTKANVKLGLFFLQMTFAEQLNVKVLRTSD